MKFCALFGNVNFCILFKKCRHVSPLSNRVDNRLDNRLYRVYKHPIGCQTAVPEPVWQPVVSCKRGLTVHRGEHTILLRRGDSYKFCSEWHDINAGRNNVRYWRNANKLDENFTKRRLRTFRTPIHLVFHVECTRMCVLYPVYTIQQVVKAVVQPVWQPCWTNSHCSFNRLSNGVVQPVWQQLYRVNGALGVT